MAQMDRSVWFVTGCSTGFGREIARQLLEAGKKVIVTARDAAKIADLAALAPDNALALGLNVDKPEQIAEAVAAAQQKFGRIDVLVNNAGYGYLAAVEEGEDDEIRALFETNVFGLAALCRAVLPIMRAQRSGVIVNLSSMGGVCGFPGIGYYNATKFAVEGLSEAMAQELAPLGVKVLIVEPGPFRTDWAGRSLKTPKRPIDAYADTAIARREATQAYSGTQLGDPARGAAAIIRAAESDAPPLRLVLGSVAQNVIGARAEAFRKELEAGRETALACDFPKEA
ncbi:NADP-dependent 3-hydroxy acid dehydrogenase YdfG [Rhodoblastus acidophilus]|uniref:NADP-dependent 3-hydroxy acid dehydrogenase YdfG n=1 Tax=Rhodoblastus acidophilus TaxID=1074 RepID=A0A212QKF9_RHOAC|nr:oxidoreductase [Rhodoblastus acidophilus]PPQ39908.1 short-chain dehydrogenase/reductase [Rhodoblastus acidophilus]RAI18476.1 short-chain dehydrogenase/reductase [Rhodoblastus acidophilus]SNB59845.1 NADP-dependent 3-hydroxy acid dehydrogenase YdfG [Rhodoblastus acidophilus]